jgi:hypothetical protein
MKCSSVLKRVSFSDDKPLRDKPLRTFSDDKALRALFGAYADNQIGSDPSKTALQSLYNAYTAQRATGDYHLRYPMTFCHDTMLRVRLTHTVVYIEFMESKSTFKFKALLDPVNLVKTYDFVEVSNDAGLYEALQRLDWFIKCADSKA